MKRSFKQDLCILLSSFLLSRVIIKLLGVSFDYNALYEYWQYLDITSLKTNLLNSLWYQHSQPPVFNLLLGIILKVSGNYSRYALEFLLLAITCCNGLLLLSILRRIIYSCNLSLILSLLYILSPATMLYENELFYTTFISLLLLIAVHFMIMVSQKQSWQNSSGMFAALSLICLTRGMYHLVWLITISGILLLMYYEKKGFKTILIAGLFSITIVGGWYLKNYLVFGNFSASSWVGINFSRIVFHNNEVPDSNNIASVHPFMPISYYKRFVSDDYKREYAGVNDRILLMETKNDRYINMNNAGYIKVSKKYMAASLLRVNQHPLSYLKNVFTAFIIYFTPASSYFKVTKNDNQIRYYDMLYSFNPAHLFKDDLKKKQSLVIAAIPKLVLYTFTFFIMITKGLRSKSFSFLTIFIIITILFSLTVSSLLDYGENMRFRYEIEPLFLILAAQAIVSLKQDNNTKEIYMNDRLKRSNTKYKS